MWFAWIFNKVTLGIAHFAIIYPCIFWAIDAVPLFRTLREHPLPSNIPHRREIYMSQGISAVLSVVLIIWTLPSAAYIIIGSMKKKGNWLILYCVVDWSIVALLIASSIWQSYYLPNSFSGCHAAKTWQVIGNDTNLFSIMVSKQCSDGSCSCNGKCHDFVEAWVLNLVVVIFTGFSAIYPVLNVPIPWPLVWLYGHTQALSKLAIRAIERLWALIQSNRADKQINLQAWRQKRKATIRDIFIEDVDNRTTLSLVRNLHYADIVSLSLTSSTLHGVIFPKRRNAKNIESLKLVACGDQKSECWCCGIEICKACEIQFPLQEPLTKTHVERCEPYCSACYYRVLARRYVSGSSPIKFDSYSRSYGVTCACRITASEQVTSPTKQQRSLCRFCGALDNITALSVREAREEAELRYLTKQQLRCVVCERGLSKEGLRWWGCSLCKKECNSRFHPMWDKKSR